MLPGDGVVVVVIVDVVLVEPPPVEVDDELGARVELGTVMVTVRAGA